MKSHYKFKIRKSNLGYYVDCVFYYRELAALYCILWKCKQIGLDDRDLIDSIMVHIDSLLNDIDHA